MQWSRATEYFIIAFLTITFLLTIIGFCIGTSTGLLILSASILFGLIFKLYLYNQNRKISYMTEEIDKVLHNAEHLYISASDEGELSILQSEIVKMTQCIREQNNILKREKKYLADSLADIAHQLRTPLTSVNMVLSFVEMCEEQNERKELLREADSLLIRVDSLLTALLRLSRMDAGVIKLKYEKFYVEQLINHALLPLQIPIELKEITIQKNIPSNATLMADGTWISEALQNILKNCMESVGECGLIEINCEDNLLYTLITIHERL